MGIGRSPAKTQWPYKVLHLVDQWEEVIHELDHFWPDVIVNFAALGERAASLDPNSFHLYYQTNVTGLARIQGKLQGKKYLKRFIQIGSGEVYGSVDRPIFERDPVNPTTPYAVSKATFDQHLLFAYRQLGFPMNILRPCNLYCEGQQPYRVIPKAVSCVLEGKKLGLTGRSRKVYMHASDLSTAIELVMEKAPLGEIYNVSPDHHQVLSHLDCHTGPITIPELVSMVADVAGVRYEDLVEEKPPRPGADACYWFNSRKLQSLGWQPRISLEEGLTKMVSWHQEEKPANQEHYRLRA